MPSNLTPGQTAMYTVEAGVLICGLVVWYLLLWGRRRHIYRAPRLPFWGLGGYEFGMMALQVICCALLGLIFVQTVVPMVWSGYRAEKSLSVIVVNLGMHLGVLAGVIVASVYQKRARPSDAPPVSLGSVAPRLSVAESVGAGFLTFCAVVLLLYGVGFVWQALLVALGIPVEKQDLIDMFAHAETSMEVAIMTFVATVVVPLTEEITFRAGLFRFARGRLPRWLAYTLPAALFAALHFNVGVFGPLFALGVVFSVAYERTGRILVTIIAHCLFNLHTILLVLFAGIQV